MKKLCMLFALFIMSTFTASTLAMLALLKTTRQCALTQNYIRPAIQARTCRKKNFNEELTAKVEQLSTEVQSLKRALYFMEASHVESANKYITRDELSDIITTINRVTTSAVFLAENIERGCHAQVIRVLSDSITNGIVELESKGVYYNPMNAVSQYYYSKMLATLLLQRIYLFMSSNTQLHHYYKNGFGEISTELDNKTVLALLRNGAHLKRTEVDMIQGCLKKSIDYNISNNSINQNHLQKIEHIFSVFKQLRFDVSVIMVQKAEELIKDGQPATDTKPEEPSSEQLEELYRLQTLDYAINMYEAAIRNGTQEQLPLHVLEAVAEAKKRRFYDEKTRKERILKLQTEIDLKPSE